MAKMKRLGIGDKATVSGDPQDMGLNHRERTTNDHMLRGDSGYMTQRPSIKKDTMKTDRGTFKCC